MSGVELWFLGQSGFRLRDPQSGTVAFVDPYLTDSPNRTWQAPVRPVDLAEADLVLCTHEHIDHFDQPAIKAANETPGARFTLVLPEPIIDMALEIGIPPDRIIGAQPGQEFQVAGAHIWAVPACHGVHVSDAYSFGTELSNGLVRFLGYVIELGGVHTYHAGDTIPYDGQVDLLRPLKPEIALLPINGRDYFREQQDLVGNMDFREAATLANDIGANLLVPMHWDIFQRNQGYPGVLVRFVEENLPQLNVMVFGRSGKLIYNEKPRITPSP
jgi:L-ascorbate metabolism protein UlaG (beta-lactamase superfamily)